MAAEVKEVAVRARHHIKDEYNYKYFTHDFYEYENGKKHMIVKGRLKKHLSFWSEIGTNDFILDVIENGYKIPLYSLPPKGNW